MFKNTKKMDQAIKQSFMFNLWEWVKVYIGDCPFSMLDFVDLVEL